MALEYIRCLVHFRRYLSFNYSSQRSVNLVIRQQIVLKMLTNSSYQSNRICRSFIITLASIQGQYIKKVLFLMVEALLTLSLCFRAEGNKAYPLKMKNGILSVYCHMTDDLGACGGGGWTLVMKIDGNEVFKSSPLGCHNSSKTEQRIRGLISLRGLVTMVIPLNIFLYHFRLRNPSLALEKPKKTSTAFKKFRFQKFRKVPGIQNPGWRILLSSPRGLARIFILLENI